LFGYVEEFIAPKVVDLARDVEPVDREAFHALANFAAEEVKHMTLFRELRARVDEAMGFPLALLPLPERERIDAAASGASAAGVRAMGRDPAERALALASLARWPGLDRELDADTGYRRGGGLRVALAEDAWRAAPAWVAGQRGRRHSRGGGGRGGRAATGAGHRARCAGRRVLRDRRPGRGAAGRACVRDGGPAAGARLDEGVAVTAIAVEGGRVTGVLRGDGARIAADVVIAAAGVWTEPLLAGTGSPLALHTRALQMLLTHPAPGRLEPVVSAFDRALSFKQAARERGLSHRRRVARAHRRRGRQPVAAAGQQRPRQPRRRARGVPDGGRDLARSGLGGDRGVRAR
jgi:glycine/D-amino acid oxidase-like deaminating enzyme